MVMKFRTGAQAAGFTLHKVCPSTPTQRMQVTEEDGGRLNAFAREPRMVVMEEGEQAGGNSRVLLIAGAVLVAALVAVAAGISH
jgi:hypothetical protein